MVITLLATITLLAQPLDFQGYWLGTLKARAREMRLLIHVTATDPPAATYTSIDQDNRPNAPKDITIEGRRITVTMPNGSKITGTLAQDGRTFEATYEVSGAVYPLVFTRTDGPPKLSRPQYPTGPLPYHSEEIEVDSGGVRLVGTFTRPRDGGPFPAVLLISGSGPQDRDETVFGHKPFLVLSDYLTRRGVAVLRMDDRGAGASAGTRATATIEDWAADATAAVRHLTQRADVDPRRIGLVGHSEGGIVAPIVARQPGLVSFLVLLGAPALDGRGIAMLQAERIARAAGAPEESIAFQQALNARTYDMVARETDPQRIRAAIREIIKEEMTKVGVTAPEAHALLEKQMEPAIQRGLSPWFRHFLTYDPVPTIRALRVPILALFGAHDVQVPAAENAPLMAAAIAVTSPLSRAETLPALNHMFQTSPTGAMEEYGRIDETFAPAALEVIAAWIRRVTG